nr:MAG TPA: hypothetical protein [Caudoviricetes sp.]
MVALSAITIIQNIEIIHLALMLFVIMIAGI